MANKLDRKYLISQFGSEENLKKLERIELDHKGFKTVDGKAFEGLTSLQLLWLGLDN